MDHHLSHPDWTAAVGTAHLCVVQGEFTEQSNNRGIQGQRENFKAPKYCFSYLTCKDCRCKKMRADREILKSQKPVKSCGVQNIKWCQWGSGFSTLDST